MGRTRGTAPLATPAQLLDYIVHCHHRYLRKVLPQLLARPVSWLSETPAINRCTWNWPSSPHEANPQMFREEMEVFPGYPRDV